MLTHHLPCRNTPYAARRRARGGRAPQLIASAGVDATIRQAAAVNFKNLVKYRWVSTEGVVWMHMHVQTMHAWCSVRLVTLRHTREGKRMHPAPMRRMGSMADVVFECSHACSLLHQNHAAPRLDALPLQPRASHEYAQRTRAALPAVPTCRPACMHM